MNIEEVVWLGRDNAIALSLLSDNAAILHTTLTRCQVIVGTTTIDSDTSPELFDLTLSDRLLLKFGGSDLEVGRHAVTLIVFDAEHTNGLIWDEFVIVVK